jgi:hypothetical protein
VQKKRCEISAGKIRCKKTVQNFSGKISVQKNDEKILRKNFCAKFQREKFYCKKKRCEISAEKILCKKMTQNFRGKNFVAKKVTQNFSEKIVQKKVMKNFSGKNQCKKNDAKISVGKFQCKKKRCEISAENFVRRAKLNFKFIVIIPIIIYTERVFAKMRKNSIFFSWRNYDDF